MDESRPEEPRAPRLRFNGGGRRSVRNSRRTGTQREGETYSYDSAGRKTTTVVIPGRELPELRSALVIAYGIDEDADEGLFYDANHRLLRRLVRSRDQGGRVLREVLYFGGDTLHDLPGDFDKVPPEERERIASLFRQLFTDQAFSSVDYTYDAKGRMVEQTARMGSLGRTAGPFATAIATIRSKRSRNTTAEVRISMMVESCTPLRTRRGNNTRASTTSTIDHGNWIERTTWSPTDPGTDFQRVVRTRRTITYYG